MFCIAHNKAISFADPEFPYLLRYRFRREQKYGILSDIYDGQEYCKHSMFFASEYNVSFALNFDGAPNRESCGDVEGAEDVEGRLSGDDNPSESGSSAGQHRVSDGELSVLLISARTRGISARTRAILARKRGVPVRGISARMIAAAMKI